MYNSIGNIINDTCVYKKDKYLPNLNYLQIAVLFNYILGIKGQRERFCTSKLLLNIKYLNCKLQC